MPQVCPRCYSGLVLGGRCVNCGCRVYPPDGAVEEPLFSVDEEEAADAAGEFDG